jgi:hypothetical protein
LSRKDNQFTKERPDADVPVLKGPDVEIINAITALLREQRHFDRQTVTKFKKLFGDHNLMWWIIAAGVGGIVELVRGLVDIWFHYHHN